MRRLLPLLWLVGALPLSAQADCRQALAMGLDVSGSVDAREYRQQLDGLAGALLHPDVRQALLAMPGAPVRIAVYEWSGAQDQRVILPWTEIDGPTALERAAARLRATGRQPASRTTGLGAAMLAGAALLAQQAGCPRRTLDVSGDGTSNSGPRPREIRNDPALNGIVINGLVIGGWGAEDTPARRAELARLAAYFRAEVIRGPGAFVETAGGYADYEAAMVRKLLRELEGMNLSRLDQ
jgi:hypothetical protein